jgi:hypothetical protein
MEKPAPLDAIIGSMSSPSLLPEINRKMLRVWIQTSTVSMKNSTPFCIVIKKK